MPRGLTTENYARSRSNLGQTNSLPLAQGLASPSSRGLVRPTVEPAQSGARVERSGEGPRGKARAFGLASPRLTGSSVTRAVM